MLQLVDCSHREEGGLWNRERVDYENKCMSNLEADQFGVGANLYSDIEQEIMQ